MREILLGVETFKSLVRFSHRMVKRENKPGRVYSIVGIVLASIALLFLPIVLGPAGIILGYIGR